MTRTKITSREKYSVFEDRALQYYDSMHEAFENGRYEVCASNAVHCTICVVDAMCVLKLGKRSAGQNHVEVISLLKEVNLSDEQEKTRICNCLYELLQLKTPVEYGDKKTSKAVAEKAMHLCKKIYLPLLTEIGKIMASGGK